MDTGRLTLMARAVEQVAEGVAVFDLTDHVVYANRALEVAHAAEPGGLEGRHLRSFVPDAEAVTERRARADAAGIDVTRLEITVPSPDRDRTVQVSVSSLRECDGSRIGRVVCVLDISDHKDLEARLEQAAVHDPLTGLPNRLLFLDRLGQALAAATRTQQPIAVLFLDLDSFKTVNDTHGHHVGDQLLIQVAARLAGCTRDSDTLARFGGDEFVALLTNLGPDHDATAVAAAARMLSQLAPPFTACGVTLSVTASIGTAVTFTGKPMDVLHAADAAMYEAKASGPSNIATSSWPGRLSG